MDEYVLHSEPGTVADPLVSGPYRGSTDAKAEQAAEPALVECSDLSLTYDGRRQSVNRISFSVQPGTIFALLGPNGAGKTSTLRMLAALVTPSAGEVHIDGLNTAESPHEVRQLIGYLPDDFALYDQISATEQLRFFARLYGIEAEEASRRIKNLLTEFDLWDQRERSIGEFSRGMKQRLGLAKTLLHKPKVLLLDEPASALDPGSRAKLRESLLRLKAEGQTIIISSHILPDLAGLADSVGILERGKLVFTGPINEAAVAQSGQMSYVIHTLVPHKALAAFEDFGPRLLAHSECEKGFEVALSGGPDAVAELLEKLTLAGARVCHLAPKESAIEAVYRMSAAERVA